MYKKDLALNNLQWLTYHKTQQNQLHFKNLLNLIFKPLNTF